MKKRFQRAEPLAIVVVIAAFYGVLHLIGVNCPIRFLTGISCPGCGMTRAWISLLQGNLSAAVSYHPLLFTVVPAVIAVFFRSRIPKRIFSILTWALILLFLAVYLYRMLFSSSDVVVFRPRSGVLYRAIHQLLR